MNARKFIEAVAAMARNAPAIDEDDGGGLGLEWKNGELSAGVFADDLGARVYFGGGVEEVRSPQDAVDVLRAIFHDEVICIWAFEGPEPRFIDLADCDRPVEDFHKMGGRDGMPTIDSVWIRSWSGASDQGGPPEGFDPDAESGESLTPEELDAYVAAQIGPEEPDPTDWGEPIVK